MATQMQGLDATFRWLVDNVPADLVLLFDPQLRCVMASGQRSRITRLLATTAEGRTLWEIAPGERGRQLEPRLRRAMVGRRSEVVLPWYGSDIAVALSPVRDPGGAVVGALACCRELAAHGADHDEPSWRPFDDAPNGMAVVGTDGRFVRVNRALCQLTGRSGHQLRGSTLAHLVHPGDVDAAQVTIGRLVAGVADRASDEQRLQLPDGCVRWVLVSGSVVRDPSGQALHVLVDVADIDDRKQREQQLQRQAERDSLTGLWNRYRLEQELVRREKLAERHREVTALILLDLDGFKAVNDRHGHRAGDEVLRQVGAILRWSVRAPDLACRYGGDEFAVVLPHTTRAEAVRLADRLLATLAGHDIALDGRLFRVTATAGVADNAHGGDLVTAADEALYTAKRRRSGS